MKTKFKGKGRRKVVTEAVEQDGEFLTVLDLMEEEVDEKTYFGNASSARNARDLIDKEYQG